MEISVIIPTYNCEKAYLKESIESAINQTLKPLEIIVVDDGSTDDTKDVVSAYSNQGVKYLFQQNSGQSAARNYGIRMAQGDWIAFLDHDDVWINTKLERQVAKHNETKYEFIVTDMYLGDDINEDKKSFLSNYSRVGEGKIFDILINRSFIFPSSVLVKKSIIEEFNCFDEKLHMMEDLDLFLKISRKYEIGVIKEILVFRRVHAFNFSFHETALALKADFWEKVDNRFGPLNNWQMTHVKKHYIETIYRLAYHEFKQNNFTLARKHYKECIVKKYNVIPSIKYILLTYIPVSVLKVMHIIYSRIKR